MKLDLRKLQRGAAALLLSGAACALLAAPVSAAAALPQSAEIPLTEEYFPDAAFREAVTEYDRDANGALSAEERRRGSLSLYGVRGIEDLTGVEYFTDITSLWLYESNVTELDLTVLTRLKDVSCYDNALLGTLLLPAGVESVSCSGCSLTTLDLSACTELESLSAGDNRLAALDVTNCPNLRSLYVDRNDLTELALQNCPELERLSVSGNKLTALDISACPNLKEVDCDDNRLAALDVSACPQLTNLSCGINRLTALELSGNPELKRLYCGDNRLTALDVSANPKLESVFCYSNDIPELDLSGCAKITRDGVGASDGCKVRYAAGGGWGLDAIWMAVRVLLGSVAVIGAFVWLVQRSRAKKRKS